MLRVLESDGRAEMVVHVPAESLGHGVPAGNRTGRLVVSERAYEMTFPGDSGGVGDQAWVRLQFQFEIDRYTATGTMWIGEGSILDRSATAITCEVASNAPRM